VMLTPSTQWNEVLSLEEVQDVVAEHRDPE
jgi:hypothetical protein